MTKAKSIWSPEQAWGEGLRGIRVSPSHNETAITLRGRPVSPTDSGSRPTASRHRPRLIAAVAAGCAVLLIGAYLLLAAHGQGSTRHGQHEGLVIAGESGIPASVSPPHAIPGRLQRVHFYSRALGRIADYLVYLPADYTPSRRLPVFYGLHGMPGRPLAFTAHADIEPQMEKLIRQGRVPPMILVFPDGRIDGRTATDSEWANTPSGRFESYVVDVVHDVDHRFATLPHRQDRVIAGLSAGAYGAANVGLHQLRLFGSIQVWSGYFIETHDGVFAHAAPAQMAFNSPIDYLHRLRRALKRYPLRIFIYIGHHDESRPQTAPMAAALKAEGAGVGWAIYPGGHSWQLWSAHLDQMLVMAGYGFRHPLARR
jgi:enterochelin esterase-like enzyme